jgi:glutaredoxin
VAAYCKIRYHGDDVSVRVEIYGKPECGLCDEAKEVLVRVRGRHAFELEVIDISENSELMSRYGEEIPVVFIGGRKAFKYHVNEAELVDKLVRAQGAS